MPNKVNGRKKMVPLDLAAAIDDAGVTKYELAAYMNRTVKTIDNWIKKGQVEEKHFIKIKERLQQNSHHWLWRMDEEPNSDNWVIKQGITLLREAITEEGQSREDKFGLVIAVCTAQVNPLTGEEYDHSEPERLMVDVLKSRALYFSEERSEEGEVLFDEIGEKADVVLDAIKKDSGAQECFSPMYVRAAVEAKLGQNNLKAEKGGISYEEERNCLRFLQELVRNYRDTGCILYQELLAKLLWNEANTHCAAGPDTVKYADLPIQELISFHGPRLMYCLIKKDTQVSKVLNVPAIAEMLGLDDASAA